ncbi:hypothetical protein C8J27_106267 [Rhodobacter aestuarii]|uniref:Uncharacterized protein n=1 Tax=Rhodobacter aestuarii TaxID=453582 RepID=A0A1N7MCT0_9RHOB|nr:hypothetical protein C8J27_106267 [Rhodobacter aestuarii]SIS83857.1 hypothetical protein SAMN05421580_105267 [Rhodobacter aestuarii]
MRRLAITCALLLAACGADPAPPPLAGLDLAPCAGWTGGVPDTEQRLMRAAAAERAGRLCANAKLVAVGEGAGSRE